MPEQPIVTSPWLALHYLVAIMEFHELVATVTFAEGRTGNEESRESVRLACSLFATNIQHQTQRVVFAK